MSHTYLWFLHCIIHSELFLKTARHIVFSKVSKQSWLTNTQGEMIDLNDFGAHDTLNLNNTRTIHLGRVFPTWRSSWCGCPLPITLLKANQHSCWFDVLLYLMPSPQLLAHQPSNILAWYGRENQEMHTVTTVKGNGTQQFRAQKAAAKQKKWRSSRILHLFNVTGAYGMPEFKPGIPSGMLLSASNH